MEGTPKPGRLTPYVMNPSMLSSGLAWHAPCARVAHIRILGHGSPTVNVSTSPWVGRSIDSATARLWRSRSNEFLAQSCNASTAACDQNAAGTKAPYGRNGRNGTCEHEGDGCPESARTVWLPCVPGLEVLEPGQPSGTGIELAWGCLCRTPTLLRDIDRSNPHSRSSQFAALVCARS